MMLTMPKREISWIDVIIACMLTITLGTVWYQAFSPFIAFFISITSATFTTYMYTEFKFYLDKLAFNRWMKDNADTVEQLQKVIEQVTLTVDGVDNGRHDQDTGAGNPNEERNTQGSQETGEAE